MVSAAARGNFFASFLHAAATFVRVAAAAADSSKCVCVCMCVYECVRHCWRSYKKKARSLSALTFGRSNQTVYNKIYKAHAYSLAHRNKSTKNTSTK